MQQGTDFVLRNNVFSTDEVDSIIALEDTFNFFDAGLGKARKLNPDIRISEIARVTRDANTEWVYERFIDLATKVNRQVFGLKLYSDLVEKFQYTVYNGDEQNGGHYTWHRDTNNKEGMSPRKLTLVMQMSDPSEYEGGLLQLGEVPDDAVTLERKKGLIVAFPSYARHRVTPVTSGTRKTLVLWFSGE